MPETATVLCGSATLEQMNTLETTRKHVLKKNNAQTFCSALSHGPLLFPLQAALPVFFGGWGAKDALTKQQSAPRRGRGKMWKVQHGTANVESSHCRFFFVLKVKR